MEAGAKLYLCKSDFIRRPQTDNNALYVPAILFSTSPSSRQQQRRAKQPGFNAGSLPSEDVRLYLSIRCSPETRGLGWLGFSALRRRASRTDASETRCAPTGSVASPARTVLALLCIDLDHGRHAPPQSRSFRGGGQEGGDVGILGTNTTDCAS
jgi:hypothetical protein